MVVCITDASVLMYSCLGDDAVVGKSLSVGVYTIFVRTRTRSMNSVKDTSLPSLTLTSGFTRPFNSSMGTKFNHEVPIPKLHEHEKVTHVHH